MMMEQEQRSYAPRIVSLRMEIARLEAQNGDR